MVHGDYTVHDMEDSKPTRPDRSYRKCVVTMFIVFLLCVIIILIVWRMNPDTKDRYVTDDRKTDHRKGSDVDTITSSVHTTLYTSRVTEPTSTTIKKIRTTTPQRFAKIKVKVTSPSTTEHSTHPTSTLLSTLKIDTTTTRSAILTSRITTLRTTVVPPVAQQTSSESTVNIDTTIGATTNYSTDRTTIPGFKNATATLSSDTTTTAETATTTAAATTAAATTAATTKTHLPLIILHMTTPISTTSNVQETTEQGTHVDTTETTDGITTDYITDASTDSTTLTDDETVTNTEFSTPTKHVSATNLSNTVTEDEDSTTDDLDTTDTMKTSVLPPRITTVETTTVSSPRITTAETTSVSSLGSTTAGTETTSVSSLGSTTAGTETTSVLSPRITTADTESTSVSSPRITTAGISSTSVSSPRITTAGTETTTATSPVAISPVKDNDTCSSSECKVLASRMLSLMNHSMDPCDNFYEFACGGLRDNHALLQEVPEQDVWNRIATAVRKVNSTSNSIYQKFRYYYDQCVDYEHTVNSSVRLELARKVVAEVDKMYNKLEWAQANSNFSLTDLLVKLFHINSGPLFDVSVDVDHDVPTKFQLKMTVPRSKSKLQLESVSVSHCKSHVYSDDPNHVDMTAVYETNYLPCIRNFSEYLITLEKAVKELELYDNTSAYNISQDIAAIKFFIEFDVFSSLEEITAWEIRTHTLEKNFKLVTVGDLTASYPEVNWEVLFGALLNEAVNRDTKVQLYFENYFDKLFGQLRSSLSNATARHVIHNGLLAMLAHDIYLDLVEPRPCDREEYCLRIASGLMEDVSSSLYLSTFTSSELSNKEHELVTLFNQVKNVLNDEITQAVWLDNEARSSMLDKLNKMKVMADGGRALLGATNFLTNQLNDQHLNLSDNYFENSMRLLRRFRTQIYSLVTFKADPTLSDIIWTFFLLPYDTRAIAVYQLNSVIIPYGMIGLWKSTNNLPSFVWKARVGNEIARQIVHHFDTTGILYGPEGRNEDFLQDSAKDLYNEAYKDCEDSFDTFKRTWTNQKNQIYQYTVNAVRTMNEHFTDNSALWLTHKLFNKTAVTEPLLPWLDRNHDELYILLAAQEFCSKAELLDYTVMMFESEQLPPYLRAENMVVNSEVFGHVYKCPKGGKQNPNVKCAPFPQASEDMTSSVTGPLQAV